MSAPAFLIADWLDEDLCCLWVMRARWPGARPVRPGGAGAAGVCRRLVEPYGRVIHTGTIFWRARRSCREVSLLPRGFAQGVSTNPFSEELETDYGMLLERRGRFQTGCIEDCLGKPGFDAQDTRVVTDEWRASSKPSPEGRPHATVNHGQTEWARDDDGDGLRKVYRNTMESLSTSLRNRLRPFRGVSKKHLQDDVTAIEWGYNRKRVDREELWKTVSRVVDRGVVG